MRVLTMMCFLLLTGCASGPTYDSVYGECIAVGEKADICHASAQNYCLNNACVWQ